MAGGRRHHEDQQHRGLLKCTGLLEPDTGWVASHQFTTSEGHVSNRTHFAGNKGHLQKQFSSKQVSSQIHANQL